MKKISMKTKGNTKTFDEGFEQFIVEHCELKNFRSSTIKYYREMTKDSFYKLNSNTFTKYVIINIL